LCRLSIKVYYTFGFYIVLKNASFGATLQDEHDPFIVCDLGDVIHKYKNWMSKLPRVELFYGKFLTDFA